MRFTNEPIPEETIVALEDLTFEGLNGIEVSGSGEYRYRNIPGIVGVTLLLDIKNASSIEVSEIDLQAEVKDPEGNVLAVIETQWNGCDIPLAIQETVGLRGYRGYESQTVPPGLSAHVRVTKVLSVKELPPVHRPQAGEYLYLALSNDHMARIKENPPVSIKVGIDRMGGRKASEVTEENALAELVDAFTEVRIRNNHGAFITDNYNHIHFMFADGEEYGINLVMRNMTLPMRNGTVCFELDNFEPFFKLMAKHCGLYYEDQAEERLWFLRGRRF